MAQGFERRKNRRLPIQLSIEVDKLFKQDYVTTGDVNANIVVNDISKTGIGFTSKAVLPVNYYFHAKITLGEKEFFRTVIKILRTEPLDQDTYSYGAEFIGLAPFLADKVDDYEKKLQNES